MWQQVQNILMEVCNLFDVSQIIKLIKVLDRLIGMVQNCTSEYYKSYDVENISRRDSFKRNGAVVRQ